MIDELLEVNGVRAVFLVDADGFLVACAGTRDLVAHGDGIASRAALLVNSAASLQQIVDYGDPVGAEIGYGSSRVLMFVTNDGLIATAICTLEARPAQLKQVIRRAQTQPVELS